MKKISLLILACSITTIIVMGQKSFESDTVITSLGTLEMTFIGHGTLMFTIDDYVIHIDPVSRYSDYATLPDADLILVTHEHGDHLDPAAIKHILKSNTVIICSESCADELDSPVIMKNGDEMEEAGIKIEAVPAYNLVHKRSNGEPFHPKGIGNGYVLTIGDKKVYIGGDTEIVPEMGDLKDIYCAFLPMNLPYTMTPNRLCYKYRS